MTSNTPGGEFEDGISPEDDLEDSAPLDASELRGDENFRDLPVVPDEPTGPGIDYAELDANHEINDAEAT